MEIQLARTTFRFIAVWLGKRKSQHSCRPQTKYDGKICFYRRLSVNRGGGGGSIPRSLVPYSFLGGTPGLWFLILSGGTQTRTGGIPQQYHTWRGQTSAAGGVFLAFTQEDSCSRYFIKGDERDIMWIYFSTCEINHSDLLHRLLSTKQKTELQKCSCKRWEGRKPRMSLSKFKYLKCF